MSDKVQQFLQVTDSGNKLVAEKFIAKYKNVDEAVIHYMEMKNQSASTFAHFARGGNAVDGDNFMALFEEIGVDPAAPVSLMFCWHFCIVSPSEGTITDVEFAAGCLSLGFKSADDLKKKVPEMEAAVIDPKQAKGMFTYTYNISLEEGQRSISQELALYHIRSLLAPMSSLGASFADYLDANLKKGLPRDTWNMAYDFIATVKPDLSNFDEDACWPVLIDDFVEEYRAKL